MGVSLREKIPPIGGVFTTSTGYFQLEGGIFRDFTSSKRRSLNCSKIHQNGGFQSSIFTAVVLICIENPKNRIFQDFLEIEKNSSKSSYFSRFQEIFVELDFQQKLPGLKGKSEIFQNKFHGFFRFEMENYKFPSQILDFHQICSSILKILPLVLEAFGGNSNFHLPSSRSTDNWYFILTPLIVFYFHTPKGVILSFV